MQTNMWELCFKGGLSLIFFRESSIVFFSMSHSCFLYICHKRSYRSPSRKINYLRTVNVNGFLNDAKYFLPISILWRTSSILYLWIESLFSCIKTSNSWSKTNNSYSFDSIGNATSIFSSFATSKLVIAKYVPSIGKNISNPSSLCVHGNKYISTIIWTPKLCLQLNTCATQSQKYACRRTLYIVIWQL